MSAHRGSDAANKLCGIRNEKRIPAGVVAQNEGYDSQMEMLEALVMESVVPACCSDGCQVEPDGHCQHGNPSVFVALGVV